jgi:hypothetical protein
MDKLQATSITSSGYHQGPVSIAITAFPNPPPSKIGYQVPQNLDSLALIDFNHGRVQKRYNTVKRRDQQQ